MVLSLEQRLLTTPVSQSLISLAPLCPSGMPSTLHFPSTLNLERLLKPLLFHKPFPYYFKPF